MAYDGDEIVRRLVALNRQISDGSRTYDPFGDAVAVDQPISFE